MKQVYDMECARAMQIGNVWNEDIKRLEAITVSVFLSFYLCT